MDINQYNRDRIANLHKERQLLASLEERRRDRANRDRIAQLENEVRSLRQQIEQLLGEDAA